MVHLRADEIDGARECRRCHRLHYQVIDSGMSSHMVRGSSGRVRIPRHLANGRARQQVSNLFSLRAKQELYAVVPLPPPRPPVAARPAANTRVCVRARKRALARRASSRSRGEIANDVTRVNEGRRNESKRTSRQKSNITKYTLARVNRREYSARKDSNFPSTTRFDYRVPGSHVPNEWIDIY